MNLRNELRRLRDIVLEKLKTRREVEASAFVGPPGATWLPDELPDTATLAQQRLCWLACKMDETVVGPDPGPYPE